MRVLHILDTIDPAGAGPVEAARLYCSTSRGDYQAEVLTLDRHAESWRSSWPVPVHAIGRSRILSRYSAGLVPWLRENGPRFDAVIVHGVWGYHLLGAWRALRRRVPYFVIFHGALNPSFRQTYPLKHFKKIAFWHSLTGPAVAGAAAVLYLCAEEKRVLDHAFPVRAPAEAFVPLGILRHRATPDAFFARFPNLRGKRLLLFFGRICYMKGCDLLLDGFARASAADPAAQLVLCGTDPERRRAELARRAARLGIADRITWTGPVFGDDRWPMLAAAELLVLPSRCETFPIVVLEALSCGTPVVVTRDVNIHDQIQDSGAGLVCETTADSVAAALRDWLALDRAERGAFAERAAECQRTKFDLRRAVDLHIDAIRGHLSSSRTEVAHSANI